jgi:hypothetical protein
MPKATRFSAAATHLKLMQDILVNLVRAAIQQGVSQSQIGAELMAQGYAMLTAKDMAEARHDVVAIIKGGGEQGGKAIAKRIANQKTPKKRKATQSRVAKESAARAPRTKRKRR